MYALVGNHRFSCDEAYTILKCQSFISKKNDQGMKFNGKIKVLIVLISDILKMSKII